MISLMYYMRKFCCFKFTVFCFANLTGTCYLWTEIEGKRGSCQVATCLNLHLLSLPPTKTHMILYSDRCLLGPESLPSDCNMFLGSCRNDTIHKHHRPQISRDWPYPYRMRFHAFCCGTCQETHHTNWIQKYTKRERETHILLYLLDMKT